MSTDIATLGIKVDSSDVRNASGELKILIEVGSKAEKATDGLKDSFGGLKAAIAGLGIGAIAREAVQLADTYANMQGRLSLVTSGTSELNAVTDKLFQSAQRARVGFEATTDLYSSLARSTKSLGTSQTDLLQVTETINKALIVSGASASTAEGALVQLSQGFASGTLRGDELNAVLEGTPRLAQAIADGMGVTVGQLRALGSEGKITGETVFNALKTQKDAVEQEFAKMPTTVAQSFTVLSNEILKYVGQTNAASGVTGLLSTGVAGLAHNLDTIIPLVGALGLALGVGFVTNAVAARIAAVETGTALATMGAAGRAAGASLLSAFGGPVGIAIAAVTLGIAGFAAESIRANNVASTVNKSYEEMRKRLQDAALETANAAGNTKVYGRDMVVALPGVENLTGGVKFLADQLYRQADAAKRARIEMAATSLAEARKNEAAAAAQTAGSRRSSGGFLARGDILGAVDNAWSVTVGATRSALSGGRTDREAADNYSKAVAVSVQAAKDLKDAYTATNAVATSATRANDGEITKLKGQINELRNLRKSANAGEIKRIDKQIANKERKVDLLGTGASEDAVNSAVGNAKGGGGSGKSTAEREYEARVDASKNYVEQLQNETAAIGLNSVQQKLADAQRAAAKAPTEALRQQILAEAQSWAASTMAQEITQNARKATIEWIERERKTVEEANQSGKAMLEQLQYETRLQGMNAEQRAIAVAERELETKGIREGTLAWDLYGRSIVAAAGAKGALEGQADDAAAIADSMRAVNDNVRDATDSFAKLFGTAGEGFASLVEMVGDYAEKSAEAEARIAEARYRYGADSVQAKRAEADAAEEASSRELQSYANVLHAVKGLFKEKSTAYKIMEAAEKAYAAVRLALAIKEIFFETARTTAAVAGAGVRATVDTAETGTSVINSGIRAAAHGVEAIAKAISSLPFPLNLVAGAATAAALIGFGVKVFGGGGGGGSAATSGTKEESKPTDYSRQNSAYSVLQTAPGYGTGSGAGGSRSGYSNDNSAAPAANMSGGLTIKFGDTNIQADGANSETVNQMRDMLAQERADTIEKARQAVRNDRLGGYGRQTIGGVN